MAAHGEGPIPALARGGIDRSADERSRPGLLDRLRHDVAARVLLIHGDAAPVSGSGLRYLSTSEVPGEAEWAFLGRDAAGAPLLTAVLPDGAEAPSAIGEWGSLRATGGDLPAADADAFVEALSLGRWLRDAAFCPACGARTELRTAGWSRLCSSCGREHFPRTDPAIIVAVTSGSDPDRILLGSNALWGANRFSCFAGFVEAGESLETAVTREVGEEAGVRVTDIEYRSSQAWPYPRSLMLGFRAVAVVDGEARPDGEEIAAVRWFTRDEIRSALDRGDTWDGSSEDGLLLPGRASIAHRLIVDWCAGVA
ncbi:NAD(+) diphosphatase [Microbacterium sp.]|uniref:NAD(+) diphosphatase n=1 Tax=Microbacterium sp. TaxID=51671 RepID=UPI000927C77D|nr:NAD(+) diphosphatase [Microbacterium sp.]MBN9179561.1 NAD(+) diphosphatase [Microbacterium sp.]MBN9186020.1 NAD(+) diphosphatase [Microbacterium sp.]MBN9191683.1 NAD(+) diphosphatase [Microbacterium sp.]OJU68411.1 MAG: NADH pyrophosphatase [Microbacterium sp. 70-38]